MLQSTISDNLPLRLYDYSNELYKNIVDFDRRFQKKLVKIPRPEFIVLYNGKEPFPDHKELRLSDAFMDAQGLKQSENVSSISDKPPLELIVQVYNINQGHNPEMLKKSVILNGYSILISKIGELLKSKLTLAESLDLAIKYCIENNILKDFLKKHGAEVYNMLYGEYRIEDEIAAVKREVREDTWEEAWEECSNQKNREIVRKSLAKGLAPDIIQEITGLDLETIQRLAEK